LKFATPILIFQFAEGMNLIQDHVASLAANTAQFS
jgi:hypothetical protein